MYAPPTQKQRAARTLNEAQITHPGAAQNQRLCLGPSAHGGAPRPQETKPATPAAHEMLMPTAYKKSAPQLHGRSNQFDCFHITQTANASQRTSNGCTGRTCRPAGAAPPDALVQTHRQEKPHDEPSNATKTSETSFDDVSCASRGCLPKLRSDGMRVSLASHLSAALPPFRRLGNDT